ncbi:hypothetical protein DA2_3474 [Desulfovibrio sp. A2]|nr:hypothetical protein DA2_3474 [Desulfovibrio sp. A2]
MIAWTRSAWCPARNGAIFMEEYYVSRNQSQLDGNECRP